MTSDVVVAVAVSVTSALLFWRAGGLTVVDGLKKPGSTSRRAKASNANPAGGCTGAVGALPANGDRTALITVDTGSAGVGLMAMDAVDAGAIAGAAAVEDIGAVVRATARRVKSGLLSRAVGSAADALTTAESDPVFAGVKPGPGREVARVPVRPFDEVGVDGVRAAVVAADPDEPVVVLVC